MHFIGGILAFSHCACEALLSLKRKSLRHPYHGNCVAESFANQYIDLAVLTLHKIILIKMILVTERASYPKDKVCTESAKDSFHPIVLLCPF